MIIASTSALSPVVRPLPLVPSIVPTAATVGSALYMWSEDTKNITEV